MNLTMVCCYNCEHEPELHSESDGPPFLWQVHCLVCGSAGPCDTVPEAAVWGWNAQELDKLREQSYAG